MKPPAGSSFQSKVCNPCVQGARHKHGSLPLGSCVFRSLFFRISIAEGRTNSSQYEICAFAGPRFIVYIYILLDTNIDVFIDTDIDIDIDIDIDTDIDIDIDLFIYIYR